MGQISAFINSLTTTNWISIAAIAVAVFFGTFTALNYRAGQRERKLKNAEALPEVKATINRKRYPDGWRSVQLHMIAQPSGQNFHYENWVIEGTQLLRPWSAILARAENDDYATGVFYPDSPVRKLKGKAEGRPQRFALEFFIKLKSKDDKGKSAKFKVTYSHVNKRTRKTVKLWVSVPTDAE